MHKELCVQKIHKIGNKIDNHKIYLKLAEEFTITFTSLYTSQVANYEISCILTFLMIAYQIHC